MSRKFISSILIAAVTVTGISLSAAPAKAGNDDLAKFLFGATALIIIGKAVSNNRAHATPRHEPRVVRPQPRHRKALPSSCLRLHHTWDGRVRMMSNRCLERKYRHVDRLPATCKTRLRTDQGLRKGYKMRCLRQHGYHIAQS
ncbi:hypothetical protein NBRC116601_25940 [Cognatishimia sp. WU-CL00825]|uniref:hypothetical protein n=1 Tax=Cognatishimia sp. WU-CL00825 TaxID=3127658 RepID=UPI003104D688